jgi:hypothetical protein
LSLTVLALLVGALAALGGLAYAVAHGLELWHDAKGFLGTFDQAMDEFGRRVERLASHEPAGLGRLEESVGRLRRSWAQLSVLLHALQRVRDQWAGLLAVYPRK